MIVRVSIPGLKHIHISRPGRGTKREFVSLSVNTPRGKFEMMFDNPDDYDNFVNTLYFSNRGGTMDKRTGKWRLYED